MTARIVPRPKRCDSSLTLPPAAQPRPSSPAEPQSLAYAVEDKIYVISGDFDDCSWGSVQIAQRSDWVRALALHNGRLIDGGDYGRILYTDTDELIRLRPGAVGALAVLDGRLIDGGDYEPIRYTDGDGLIRRRPNGVGALAVYNGRLIDASDTKIRYTDTDELIRERPEDDFVWALAVHDGRLIDAGDSNKIFYGEFDPITGRPDCVNALAVYNGRLIDAGNYNKVLDTLTDGPIITAEGSVTALCPLPVSLAERLARGRNFR